jgi:DNA-binding transcriptional LysR family regulator
VEVGTRPPGTDPIEVAKTSVLIAGLRRRELDFALIGLHPHVEGFERTPLHQIPLVAAMHPGHPAARKKIVSLRDIDDGQVFWLRRSYNPDYYDLCAAVFARAGFSPKFIHVDPGQIATLVRVAHGDGTTLVRKSQVEMVKGLAWRPLKEGKMLAIVVEAIWPRDVFDQRGVQRLRVLRDTARAVLKECESASS